MNTSAFPIIRGGDGFAPIWTSGTTYQPNTVVVYNYVIYQSNTTTNPLFFNYPEWDIIGTEVAAGTIGNIQFNKDGDLSGTTSINYDYTYKNIILGGTNQTCANFGVGTTASAIIAGSYNAMTHDANNGAILGGSMNIINASFNATILGGRDNCLDAIGGTENILIGGYANCNCGGFSTRTAIISGYGNSIDGLTDFVSINTKNRTFTGNTIYSGYTAVDKFAILSTPFSGNTSDVLTWDALTGRIGRVSQVNVAGGSIAADSCKLGGYTSAQYLRSDSADTAQGVITFNPATGVVPFLVDGTKTGVVTNLNAGKLNSLASSQFLRSDSGGTESGIIFFNPATGSVPFLVDGTKTGVVNNLNADKLDGFDSTAFINGCTNSYICNNITLSWGSDANAFNIKNCTTSNETYIGSCHTDLIFYGCCCYTWSLCPYSIGVGNSPLMTLDNDALTLLGPDGYANCWHSTSDKRIKEDINPIEDPIELTMGLCGVTFKRLGKDGCNYGFIAQDVEKIIPYVVTTSEIKDGYYKVLGLNDIKSISYDSIIPILTETIKKQQIQIKDLEQRIISLENK